GGEEIGARHRGGEPCLKNCRWLHKPMTSFRQIEANRGMHSGAPVRKPKLPNGGRGADPKTKPRMPWVQQFSKLGSVGVLKLCCTTAIGLIRALTDARPIKPTSTRCLSARRPNPGRGSTYRRGNSVQTTAATSHIR